MNERSAPASAIVCPFVAFEDDRDRRSHRPDHRHRCFAESVPAPRALAHQQHYCLSAAFPTCPTFADWVQREAARPVDAAEPVPGSLAAAVDEPEAPRAVARDWAAPPPWVEGRPAPGEQLGAFGSDDDQGGDAEGQPSGSAHEVAPSGEGVSPERTPPDADLEPRRDEDRPAARREEDAAGMVPAFLAGRIGSRAPGAAPPGGEEGRPRPAVGSRPPAPRPETSSAGRPPGTAQARPAVPQRRERRETSAPSWEHARRAEAFPTLRTRVGLPEIPRLAMAAIALVVAAAVLFFLPTLLAGGPSTAPGTTSPSAAASAAPSVSVPPPTPAAPTPQVYTVAAGDTLSGIAAKFGVTIDEILKANPQVKDPNKIAIGDRLTIPPKSTPTSVAPGPTAAPGGTSLP